jgi:hypothetical protein
MRHSSFPRSSILVYGQDAIHSLVQSTVIAQVESLLDNNKIEDAADLAKNFASGQALDSDEVLLLHLLVRRILTGPKGGNTGIPTPNYCVRSVISNTFRRRGPTLSSRRTRSPYPCILLSRVITAIVH